MRIEAIKFKRDWERTARGGGMSEVLFKESWDFTNVSRKVFVCVTLYACLRGL